MSELLTAPLREKIDIEVAKYPADQKQSAVMAALAIMQTAYGWLSKEVIQSVAAYLHMPEIAVYEVASFYSMYHLEPVGRYTLTLCTNLPCALSGANDAATYLQQKLKVGFNQTTADGRFTLKEAECMGACGDAPVMLVNNVRMCCRMQPQQIDQLITELTQS